MHRMIAAVLCRSVFARGGWIRGTAAVSVWALVAGTLVGVAVVGVSTLAGPVSTARADGPPPMDPPTSIVLAANRSDFAAGSSVALTATTDKDVADTASTITISDETASSVLTTCASGTTCTASTSFDTGAAHTYVATVNDLTSNEVSVARAPWTLSLSSDRSSFTAGQTATLTATANQNVGSTAGHYRIDIYDESTGGRIATCATGTVCSYGPAVLFTSGAAREYVAVVVPTSSASTYAAISKPEATSNEVAQSRAAWTVSLTSDKITFTAGEPVTLTAATNQNLGDTNGDYHVAIFDETTGAQLRVCNTGTSCAYTSSSLFSSGNPHTYVAAVVAAGNTYPTVAGEQALSNEVVLSRDSWTVALATSETTFAAGDTVTITAVANQSVGNTNGSYRIEVFDKTTGARLFGCSTDFVCTHDVASTDLSTSGAAHSYVAVVDSTSGGLSYSGVTEVQATSNEIALSRAAWQISLSSDRSTVTSSSGATLIARTNQPLGRTGGAYQVFVYNKSDGTFVGNCNVFQYGGNECDVPVNFTSGALSREYEAVVAAASSPTYGSLSDIQATSNTVELNRLPWTISISGVLGQQFSFGSLGLAQEVLLSSSVNQGTNNTPYSVVYVDYSKGSVVGSLFSSPDFWIPIDDATDIYVAYVAHWVASATPQISDIQATSQGWSPDFGLGPVGTLETRGGKNPAEKDCQCQSGDPINTATGEFSLSAIDDEFLGVGPSAGVSRTYASSDPSADGPFGHGWASSFDMHLGVLTGGNVSDPLPRKIEVVQENGSIVVFDENPDHSYTPPRRVMASLSYNPSTEHWTFVRRATQKMVFNSDFQLLTAADAHGNTVTYHHSSGKLVEITASSGRSINLVWTGSRITALSDSSGRGTSYVYNSNGDLTSATGIDGSTANYVYDTNHRMTSYTKPGGGTTSETYDSSGKVIAQTDPLGRLTTLTYSGPATFIFEPDGKVHLDVYINGQLLYETTEYGTPDAESTHYTYDSMNNVASISDPLGHVTNYTYDSQGNTLTQTDPLGKTTTWTYDAVNDVTSVTDPLGRATLTTYDGTGDRLSATTAGGEVQHWTYNGDGTVDTWADARGKTTHYSYNGVGQLASTTDPDGRIRQVGYNSAGIVTSTTDPGGNVSQFTNDPGGRVLTSTDPNGHTTTNTYDVDGNVVSIETAGGHTTTKTYDAAAELTSTTDPAGHSTGYTYTAMGSLATTTDAYSHTTTDAYNGRGLLTSVTDAGGHVTHYGYDGDGRRVSMTAPSGDQETVTFDADSRMTSSTDALGHTTHYAYDGDGELISTTDPLGRVTAAAYNADGELTSVTLPDLSTENYTYNATGQTTDFQNADSKKTTYTYDDAGLLSSKTEPGSQSTAYSYDDAGLPHVITLPDSSTEAETYDSGGRLTRVHYSVIGSTDTTYGYNSDNQRIAMTDATGASSYTYDSVGQITAETNGAGQSIGYGHDSVGQLISLTYPGSKTVNYNYNSVGEMTSVTDWSSNRTDFAWTVNGQLASQADPNGVSQARTYDSNGRTTNITTSDGSSTLAGFGYGYDSAGNLTSDSTIDPNTPIAVSHTYGYDNLSQLNTVNNGVSTSTYTNSPAGQMTANTAGSALTYNSKQELTAVTPGAGAPTTYAYDGNGARTSATVGSTQSSSASTTSFNYDPAGDLAAVGLPAIGGGDPETVNYTSNGDGLRQTRAVGSISNNFLWDTASSVPLLLDDGTNSYIYGPSTAPIAEINDSTGSIDYLSADLVGSTRLVTDSSGAVAGVNRYDEYGNVTSHTGSTDPAIGYSGNWTDPDTGLIYMRARDYDPATAQFLTVDPLVDGTRMPYAYVANNPLNSVDPTGLCGQAPEWWNPFSWNADTWQSVGAVVVGAAAFAGTLAVVVGIAGCTALTFGVCGVAVTLVGFALAGAVSSGVTYAIQPGPKSWGGFGEAVGFGAVAGVLGGAVGAIGGKILGVVASKLGSLTSETGEMLSLTSTEKGIGAGFAPTPSVIRVGDYKLPAVPQGATGEPVITGRGLQYSIPPGTPELDPAVTGIRIMNPVNRGPYLYPNGYAAYMNTAEQTINPLNGQTVLNTDPFAHIPLP